MLWLGKQVWQAIGAVIKKRWQSILYALTTIAAIVAILQIPSSLIWYCKDGRDYWITRNISYLLCSSPVTLPPPNPPSPIPAPPLPSPTPVPPTPLPTPPAPTPQPPVVDKNSLFIYSSAPSRFGNQLVTDISRRLNDKGFTIVSRRAEGGRHIEITDINVEGPRNDKRGGYIIWTATVTVHMTINDAVNNTEQFPEPFTATETAAEGGEEARGAAFVNVINKIVAFLDRNRRSQSR